MRIKFIISSALVFFMFGFTYAQKKKVTPKPKDMTIMANEKTEKLSKTKPAIPNDIAGIMKLLNNGEISLYEAYESQIVRINEVQKSLKNKIFRDSQSKLETTVLPEGNTVFFNFHNRSISIIISYSEDREIFPEVSLERITNLGIIKKNDFGEVDVFYIVPDKTVDHYSTLKKENNQYEAAMLFFPKGDKQAYEKLKDAFVNIILLYKFENTNGKTVSTKTEDTEEYIRITFE